MQQTLMEKQRSGGTSTSHDIQDLVHMYSQNFLFRFQPCTDDYCTFLSRHCPPGNEVHTTHSIRFTRLFITLLHFCFDVGNQAIKPGQSDRLSSNVPLWSGGSLETQAIKPGQSDTIYQALF